MLFRSVKALGGFLFGSGILALLSVLILGPNGTKEFINILLLSTGGEWYGMKEAAMYNLIGLLTRIDPQLDASIIRMAGWVIYGIALISSCILWFKTRQLRTPPIGPTVALALLVAPHLHFHDLTLLLIPLYELIRTSGQPGNLKTSIAIATPLAISLLLLLSNISPYLQYTVPYLIMLALALFPGIPKSISPVTTE